MASLHLTLACWDYDRMKTLEDGRVEPEGIQLNFRIRHELSLSSYVLNPHEYVFPSRFFRHQSIYVNTKAGITHPLQLAGRPVGTPEFQMTAPVWRRGILEDEYGLKYDALHYFTGNIEHSDTECKEKIPLDLGESVKIQAILKGKCLAQMLADGEIMALESRDTAPSTFGKHPDVRRLFPTRWKLKRHVIVVKRSLVKQHPRDARSRSLTKAMPTPLTHKRGALRSASKETQAAMCRDGEDKWWQDGLTRQNRRTLEKFLEYSFNQELSKKKWQVEELFAPGASGEFVV
ncbi:4,5-dihydroxyphthalate decarboxylase [Mycena pura]|uniref:4,5-dihydroxyphthalate decarboxylase n=1 Tax=Mycena pura TaxID=153505 RepID=A0AAD6VHD5_9AGAR|nr:4,5-dihydroxyphthalate decarboxylase [Mycena pura]